MPQTSTIAAALIIGFIAYIAVKGELPAYLATIIGPGKSTGAGTFDVLRGVNNSGIPGMTVGG